MSHHNFFGKLQGAEGSVLDNTKSGYFDRVNDHVVVGTTLDHTFDRLDPFSFSAWVKPSTVTDTTASIASRYSGANQGWEVKLYNGRVLFNLTNTWASNTIYVTADSGDVVDGVWAHITTTYDGSGSASGVTIYVNGSSVVVTEVYNSLTASSAANVQMYLGRRTVGTGAYFGGYLDEISIWDKELSSSEVSAVYNSGTPGDLDEHSAKANLISWWRMGDGDTFPILIDGQSSHDGTMTNMSSLSIRDDVPPSLDNNKSEIFDGVDEYLTTPDHADFAFEYNEAFSISLWVKSSNSVLKRMMSKVTTDSATRGLGIGIDGANKLYVFLVSDWSEFPSNAIQLRTTAGVVFSGTWVHCVVTKSTSSAASGFKLYIDGTSRGTTVDNDDLTATTTNSEALHIGKRANIAADLFAGNTDEVSVWNKELTASEVTEIYNAGKPDDLNQHSAETSLVSWWRMGDGDTYPTIEDQKSNHDFTMINMEPGNIVEDTP